MKLTASDIARFEEKVAHDGDGCWLWTASCATHNGYGRFWLQGRNEVAHRVAWMIHKGPIPEGYHVLHYCDRPACENPAHLWLGTQSENIQDCWDKKRHQLAGCVVHYKEI